MISIEIKKTAPDAKGNTAHTNVVFKCDTIKQVLHEYACLTAAVRDMVAEKCDVQNEAEVDATVFSAFKAGMEDMPYSEKAAAKLKKTNRG